MIPLYRTRRMESAANLLVKHCRHVLVRAAYDNYIRIRFRADMLKDPRCYFNKVASQHKKWRENGGALITWRDRNLEGPHDAIVFVECPKSMDALFRAIQSTRVLGVIYQPPTWRMHEQQIARRHSTKPAKFKRQLERLRIVQSFVETLPVFTKARLMGSLRAQVAASQSRSVRGLPGDAAPSPGKPC